MGGAAQTAAEGVEPKCRTRQEFMDLHVFALFPRRCQQSWESGRGVKMERVGAKLFSAPLGDSVTKEDNEKKGKKKLLSCFTARCS